VCMHACAAIMGMGNTIESSWLIWGINQGQTLPQELPTPWNLRCSLTGRNALAMELGTMM